MLGYYTCRFKLSQEIAMHHRYVTQLKNMWVIFLALLFINIASTAHADNQTAPAFNQLIIPPPQINAESYILLEANTGTILASKNQDKQLQPASLTKLMTLYIASHTLKNQQINLEDKVHISKKAWQTEGSRMFLNPGTNVPVSQIIQGIIVTSGNDATMAMAEFISGSEEEFIKLMNQSAGIIGMKNTHFSDVTGLPKPDNLTTAHDLALLAKAIIKDFPEYQHWYSQKWFEYNKIKQPNRNKLLWQDSSVDGLKTGHTDSAGYCLVATAKREDMRLIAVILNAKSDISRDKATTALLNYGGRFFTNKEMYKPSTVIGKTRVWYGVENEVALGTDKNIVITANKAIQTPITTNLKIKDLHAPITAGTQYGEIEITQGNTVLSVLPLLATKDIAKAGLFSRLYDDVVLFFHNLTG